MEQNASDNVIVKVLKVTIVLKYREWENFVEVKCGRRANDGEYLCKSD